jgi:SAM-dependent methyltransferase
MTTEHELRSDFVEKYIRGRGFEIGAGLSPTNGSTIDEIRFIDKRGPSEFEQLFGQSPPYQIQSLGEAKDSYPGGADFLIAHHVLEHCSNPIKVLATEWLPLLRDGGVLFLSVPSSKMITEERRIVTPIDHILDDWAFDRGDEAFESIDHITSFIVGWTNSFPDNFAYARGTVHEYTAGILSEINRRGHDLHWHTYSLDAAADLVAVAFHAVGAGIEWLDRQEIEHGLYLVAKKLAAARDTLEPEILTRYRNRLLGTYLRLGSDDRGGQGAVHETVVLGPFIRDDGFGWYADLPPELVEGDTMEEPARSSLALFEDGSPLGPAHTVHDTIRREGAGAYSHWNRILLFSTTDGTDPNTNGRRYIAAAPKAGALVTTAPVLGPGEIIPGVDRSAEVKARIPLSSGRGLEISPGAAPLIQKCEANLLYCDKFYPPKHVAEGSVPVDFVIGSRLIHDVLPQRSFDYVVSSHVMEHVPDFIQFLKSISLLLRPGGVMVSFLPDRRFTFDVLRKNSSIEEIEIAHEQRLRHPSLAMIEDVYLNSDFNVAETPVIHLWTEAYRPRPSYNSEQALKLISEADPEAADLHCWTFTPQSLRVLLNHVKERHIPDMRITEITETLRGSNEFLLHLTFGEDKKPLWQCGTPGGTQMVAQRRDAHCYVATRPATE